MVSLKVALKAHRQRIVDVTYSQILRGKETVEFPLYRLSKNIMVKFQSPKDYCFETTGHIVILIM